MSSPEPRPLLEFAEKPGFKAFVVAFLMVLLLIPLQLVREIVEDRRQYRDEAAEAILEGSGGRPALFGPYIAIPYQAQGESELLKGEVVLFPRSLSAEGRLSAEPRKRGLFSVPVLEAELELRGEFSFSLAEAREAAPHGATLHPEAARLRFELPDLRALRERPRLSLGGKELELRSEPGKAGAFAESLSAPLRLAGLGESSVHRAAYEGRFPLRGGRSLRLVSPSGELRYSLSGDWPSPSFTGYVSPIEREVSESGFRATWYIPESAQPMPVAVEGRTLFAAEGEDAGMGVLLLDSVDAYAKSYRAVRYSPLFIVVPFLVIFLFEVLGKRRFHPVQYLLVGLADCLFYLLLLSLGEILPFWAAYLVSALAVSLLGAAYAAQSLGARGWLMIPLFAALYAYLYAALDSEEYALLIGSVGLFLIVAAVMFFTRRLDWYGSRLAKGADAL